MPGARSVAARMGSVAFFEPLTGTEPRSFLPPSIHTSSMLTASLVSSALGAGCALLPFFLIPVCLASTLIGYPVFRSRFWAIPRGRAPHGPPREAVGTAPCMDRPDRLRSPVQGFRPGGPRLPDFPRWRGKRRGRRDLRQGLPGDRGP